MSFQVQATANGHSEVEQPKRYHEEVPEGHHDYHGDMAPLPLNASTMSGLQSGVDRHVLDDLYKTLLPDASGQQMPGPFNSQMRSGGNVFGLQPPQYNQFSQGSVEQSNSFPYLSISQDYGLSSQMSSEQLMQSLYGQNMGMANSMQLQKPQNYQPVPILAPEPNKPVKALSAYNFFFRDERERILNGGEEDYSQQKEDKLLSGHWFRDRTKKRRHRKTHGKITFTTLSRMVSQKWKSLADEHKAFYKQVAARDLERYRREVSEQEHSKTATNRAPMQSSVFIARTA